MENGTNQKKGDGELVRLIIRGILVFLILIAVLFLVAGRIDYWQGWVFLAFIFMRIVIGFIVIPHGVELAKERGKPGPGRKDWDKIITAFMMSASIAMLLIAPLDAGRFHWTKPLPVTVYVVGYVAVSLSLITGMWAVRVNRFFSSVVRIQTDRGHKVVDDGPYRYIRHPGYAGMVVIFLCLPIVLGSLWALIPAGANVVILVIRTHLEDLTLQRELAGYKEYAQKVRYRIVPRIW